MAKNIVFLCIAFCILSHPASAKFKGTFSCKSEQMIVVHSDMRVRDKGYKEEFLVDIENGKLILRFTDGYKMDYPITAETPYAIISHEPVIGSTYSFFFNDKLVERLFYTKTISTAFDTELRTGFCQKFG